MVTYINLQILKDILSETTTNLSHFIERTLKDFFNTSEYDKKLTYLNELKNYLQNSNHLLVIDCIESLDKSDVNLLLDMISNLEIEYNRYLIMNNGSLDFSFYIDVDDAFPLKYAYITNCYYTLVLNGIPYYKAYQFLLKCYLKHSI